MFNGHTVKKILKRNRSNKSKFYFHSALDNIIAQIQAKYRNDRMKTEGVYSIWTKLTDGRKNGGGPGFG